MAVLQTYQAELLKELDEGEGITPEAVKELRQATDLALRATKHTARAVGRSMVGMVTVERHLWLNLTDIKEKDKSFPMDAPISKDGLFGNSVTTVVKKFRAAKQQSAAFRQLIPCRPREIEHSNRAQPLAAVSDISVVRRDLNTCISRSYGCREFSMLGNSNTCGDITAADKSLEAIKGV